MTYEELLTYLKGMEADSDDRLQDDITVWNMEEGEYYPAELLEIDGSDGILDAGHMFFGFGLSMEAQ